MTPKQREAFDLLTLQLVERGYIRRTPPFPVECDEPDSLDALPGILKARLQARLQHRREAMTSHPQRDAARLSRPGSWISLHSSLIDILDERGRWEIHVEAPDYEDGDGEGLEDYLGCEIAACGSDGRPIWLDDGELIVWEGLDLALRWAEDLAAQVGAAQRVA